MATLKAGHFTAPIVGATKLHHLEDALASVNVKLSADEITSLEEPYLPHAVSYGEKLVTA
jgi:aryl-alcohol dehydrogenase-like predicted oxidoreductase